MNVLTLRLTSGVDYLLFAHMSIYSGSWLVHPFQILAFLAHVILKGRPSRVNIHRLHASTFTTDFPSYHVDARRARSSR